MRKIRINLKEPVAGQKNFEFSTESEDLSDQIALARDKAKMFSLSNIDGIYMSWSNGDKWLNIGALLKD